MSDETKKNDAVNHPAHYTFGSIEVADALEDWQMNLWRGTVIKYVVRAGRKRKETEIEDLQKAAWYLNREIERMQKLVAVTPQYPLATCGECGNRPSEHTERDTSRGPVLFCDVTLGRRYRAQ